MKKQYIKYKDLYIKTSHVTRENILKIPDLDLLPIFLDVDLRSNNSTRGYQGTAIHFPNLSPSTYIYSKFHGGFIGETEFKAEYFIELLGKDIDSILNRLNFLKDLSNAVGIVLLDGIGYPRFVDYLAEFLNLNKFLETPIEPLDLSD